MLQEKFGGDPRNVGAQGNRCIGFAEMWGHRATAVLGLQQCGGTGQSLYWACRNVGAQGNRCIGLAATIALLTVILIRCCAKMISALSCHIHINICTS